MTDATADTGRAASALQQALARPRILVPVLILVAATVLALLAPALIGNPSGINPMARLQAPSLANLFGTDQFGRSVAARTLHGTRISLLVGASVTVAALLIGVTLGLLSGFVARVDAVLMRIMDAIMSIPTILLAIALMALFGAGVFNAIIAIIIPEVPRMARVVRGVTLSIRERPYIEAAITNGARPLRLLFRHVMPMTAGPMLVQATYVFSAAVITEAILSFLGAGAPPDVPSWGNIISEGRTLFQIAPWVVIAPGVCLSILVLTVNSLGDAIRDQLDPKLRRETR
ncbi:MAG: peptide ABC transporter permease [Devosia sp. 67-54]|uniref:ABC transporter permease n=1 Tax=unclassified Devosia TaxID=196773 RepID=UPI00095E93C3|nr:MULTISPECIES: ABC transporter permease [unclassified Devosia]MBN9306727.1 ABC transporter permease [Devosia sp.]OJX16072.1 MAG: peptide ABC transporter permease [Devosia sp. 67-54]